MLKFTTHFKQNVFLFLCCMMTWNGLQAQVSDSIYQKGQLETVVVTAQKQPENIQNVSSSLSYLTEKDIEEQRIWNVSALSGLVPNLYTSHPGDGRNVMGMRGITTTSYDPAVAVYVDGVVQYNLDTYSDELLDIERIEFLRGPQGTLYGRNAMGGVINIITQQPTDLFSGSVNVDYGNYGQFRTTIKLNAPLVKSKLYLGASGLYSRDDGFYRNEFNDSQYDKKHAFLGNYYLKYLPGNHWDLTLNYKHKIGRNHGPFTLAGSMGDAIQNPFKVNQNSITRMVDNTSNASLNVQHQGEKIDFHSTTSFQSNYRIYQPPIDGDFSPLDIVSIVDDYGKEWNKPEIWTQEFRWSSVRKESQKISWMAGLFGFWSNDPVKQGTAYGEDAAIYGMEPFSTTLTTNSGKDQGFALFGQADIALTNRFDLTVGLRFDREYRKITGKSELLTKDAPPIPLSPVSQADTTGKGNYSAFSPEAVLSYKAGEDHLLYLSYKRGYRAGGISEVSENPQEPPLRSFDPEFSNNFELGVKNELMNHRLRWNLSVFYTTVDDIQISQLILPEALTVTTNEGKLKSFGLESEVTALLGKHFSVGWAAGLTHAEFKKLIVAGENENDDLAGNKQLFTPDFTSNLSLNYYQDFGPHQDYHLTGRASWLWMGTTYFDLANNLKQSPYHLFNASVGVEKDPVHIRFWTKNIFNKKYVAYAYDFGAAHLGDPSVYGVSVGVSF